MLTGAYVGARACIGEEVSAIIHGKLIRGRGLGIDSLADQSSARGREQARRRADARRGHHVEKRMDERWQQEAMEGIVEVQGETREATRLKRTWEKNLKTTAREMRRNCQPR